MKSYFAYIRVSTTRQGEHGSSLQEQKSAIEAFAARHDLQIGAWFEERVTAAKLGRREFARMTTLLRAGKADGVIIHKIDRGARNLRDWAGLGELIDAGIEVLFAHEALDLTTRGGRLAADIQAVVAADFIRNLRDEVKKGFYGRLKQGFYPLPAPRGYLDRGKCRAKEICPREGPLVAQAFELYASGKYSLDLLRHELARRGLTDGGGKPLGLNTIAVILRNPFYVGIMQVRSSGATFEGNHARLVSKKTFDKVQGIMDGRLYPRTEKHEFLFRRLIKCGQCGRSLTGERQRRHVYYRCHDRGCRGVSVAEPALEEMILQNLLTLAVDERDLGDLGDLLEDRIDRERATAGVRKDQLKNELASIEQRLTRATDALIEGVIDNETFAARKKALLLKKCELGDALLNVEQATFWKDVAERFERGFAAYLGYQAGLPAEKREIVETLGSNIVVRGKKPEFMLRFPFAELREWSLAAKGGPYGGAVRTLAARRQQAPVSALIDRLARMEAAALPIGAGQSPQSPPSPPSPREYARAA